MSTARSIERVIAKERDRSQYRRLRCGVGKPRANLATQVTTTSDDGAQTTHEGKEAVQDACMKSIEKRYSQGNNSRFSAEQLLEDLGWVGDGPKMQGGIEGKYEFPEDCPPDARAICEQVKFLHKVVSEDTLNVVIRTNLFQRWWWNTREDTQSSMSVVHFGHLMTAATNDYLTRLYVKKLNCARATGNPLSRWGRSLVVLLEKFLAALCLRNCEQ